MTTDIPTNMWYEEYRRLGEGEKEQFTRLVNLLLARTFVLRERYDAREKALVIDRDFRFLERYFSLFQGYLALAGWELNLDPYLGVAAVRNRLGANRYRLDKLTTYFLLVLRLIYQEESEKLTLRKDVVTSVRDLLEKMSLLNLADRKIPDRALTEGLSTLKQFQIIDRAGGDWKEPETRIIIYPSILLAVTDEQIHLLYERSKGWAQSREGVLDFHETAEQAPAD